MSGEARDIHSGGHPDSAGVPQRTWGPRCGGRFEQDGIVDDLDRAITMREQAIASTPDDHPDRVWWLNNMGVTLQSRFERTESMDDLERAISMKEQAVASTPDGHPDRAAMPQQLGERAEEPIRADRIYGRPRSGDLDEGARLSRLTPHHLLFDCIAASTCSDLLISQRRYKRAKDLLRAAVHLLPTISPRTLKRSDQQFNISQFSNVTSLAVSLSLADADEPMSHCNYWNLVEAF